MKAIRFESNPIIRPDMDRLIGRNINGPSLIRVPDWVPHPLGCYYLYFADHRGTFIRLAYADRLEGPWRIHQPGTVTVKDSYFHEHIASPDVHVDDGAREIRMYFHGLLETDHRPGENQGEIQGSRLAISYDGIDFAVRPDVLGDPYFRVFRWGGAYYAWAMPGRFWRSPDGIRPFEPGPLAGFPDRTRHGAILIDGSRMTVIFSCYGDAPERLRVARLDLSADWTRWRASEAEDLLAPETDYEGADLPIEPSLRGLVLERARQLRDPAVYREDGRSYLLYSIAGEAGIAIARLEL